ncbi:class I SAM-dependent methyltransferase [uncultured Sunxiuqinia sp.]|uniref:class I SAM-dependent methyltransferase n=1 Tax=uncultured Sunxiuqinia sp. TaxID=1573825 RepID=UPI002AA678E2|nr:class I SAM-dependent methyltransferase [uncultured Sunxiuqinia sp.]
MNHFRIWHNSFKNRKKYTIRQREAFYDLALPFLPTSKDDVIVDIGAGSGGFGARLNLYQTYNNVVLLDGNEETVKNLQNEGHKAIIHKVPNRLPFENKSVALVHSSHMVEHLSHKQLYSFISEVDRVLCDGGIFIISTPLLWKNFYNDLSHIKPYNPVVFIKYLCEKSEQRTEKTVSGNFVVKDLTYRYTTEEFSFIGANNIVVDFIIQVFKMVISKIFGINRYTRSGYTITFKKDSNSEPSKL